MIIGVPRERKTLEKRVALTPSGAKELIAAGHRVLIETQAGAGSFFTDHEYQEVGCELTDLASVWSQSELLVKVKEPHPDEYQFFREDLIIFDYLHLADLPELAKELLASKVTSLGYELVTTREGRLPLLEPMSEIAGKLATQVGANFLLTQNGGRGVLLGGTKEITGGVVTVIGAGVSGQAATEIALGLGATVNLVDINQSKLDAAKQRLPKIKTYLSSEQVVSKLAMETDLMILAVLVPGDRAPKVINAEQVKRMPSGSVLVDIAVDQGGASETTKVTSLAEPTYLLHDVIHYAVPNIPAQAAKTATLALTKQTLPYIKLIADKGLNQALEDSNELQISLNTHQGEIVNQVVKKALSD